MKLASKLFLSYLLVVVVGGLVLSVVTAYVAPQNFSTHMQGMGRGAMMGAGQHRENMNAALNEEIDASFRSSVNNALLISGVVAAGVAMAVSWYISRRITRPIQQMVSASQRIADGHYEEHLTHHSSDELGELTESFNRMASTLADTELMRQQLIADVSHELKTPLASINGYMDGLLDGVIEPSQETFLQVQREAARLQRLVRDLQQLSRVESGQIPLRIAPCDAVELVQSSVEWLRPQFEEQGIQLMVQIQAEKIMMLADHDRVHQVLMNLLSNALHYTPSGGCVKVGVECQPSMAHFWVKDNGTGLAPDDLQRVFQRFYRVDKSRSRSSGGSGIGLTIAQHLIHAMQGKIWAESPGLGQGSTFHFTLPLT